MGAATTPRAERDTAAAAAEWDAFLEATEGGNHLQSARWAAVKETVGWRSRLVTVRRDGALAGGGQLLMRQIRGVRVGYLPRGPVLHPDAADALDEVLSGIEVAARREKILLLKLQPPTDGLDLAPALVRRGYAASGLEAAPTATVRVDARPSPDELTAGLHSGLRKNVRRAGRRGVGVRGGGREDLALFSDLVRSTGQRKQFAAYSLGYYQAIWDAFESGGNVRLLVAEHDGEPLAALLLIAFGDSVACKMGVRAEDTEQRYANDLVFCEGLRWAHEAGYRWYDLEGISLAFARSVLAGDASREDADGTTRFKLGFGGAVTIFPCAYDLAPSRLLRWPVRRAARHMDRWRGLALKGLGRGV